jgi:hypothetical protein
MTRIGARLVAARVAAHVATRTATPLRWALGIAAVWAVAGPVAAAGWGGVAAWHLLRPPQPRTLLVAAAVLFAAVPVLWVVGNAGRLGQVSADLVTGNPAPGVIAALGLALLVTGVWRDVSAAPAPTAPSPQEQS